MSEDIKQDLPDDDDDDDIIELVNVVEQGKEKEADEDLDFSANLEAILDGMEEQEDGEDEAFPDPNPVSYDVDHNESLDIPSMDDLDNLLESLGAEENAREQQSHVVDSNGDDLDAVDEVEPEDILNILGDDASGKIGKTEVNNVSAALDKALSEKSGSGDREESPEDSAAKDEADEELDIDKLLDFEALEKEETGAKEELSDKTEKSETKDLDPFEAALLAAKNGAGLTAKPEEKVEEIAESTDESGDSEKDKGDLDPFEAALLAAKNGAGLTAKPEEKVEEIAESTDESGDSEKDKGDLDPFEAALAKASAGKDDAKSKTTDSEEILKEAQNKVPEAERAEIKPAEDEAALAKKAAQEDKAFISAAGSDDLPIDTEDLPMAARKEVEVLAEESKVPEKLEPESDPFEAALSLAASSDLPEKMTVKEGAEEKSQDDDKEEGAMRSRIDEDLDELDALLDDMLAVSPAEKKKEVINDIAANTHVLANELSADDGLFMQEIHELSDRINSLEQLNKSLIKEENISSEAGFGEKLADLQAALDEEKEKNDRFKGELEILQDENKKINEEIEKLVAETAARVIREEISALLKDLQDED